MAEKVIDLPTQAALLGYCELSQPCSPSGHGSVVPDSHCWKEILDFGSSHTQVYTVEPHQYFLVESPMPSPRDRSFTCSSPEDFGANSRLREVQCTAGLSLQKQDFKQKNRTSLLVRFSQVSCSAVHIYPAVVLSFTIKIV